MEKDIWTSSCPSTKAIFFLGVVYATASNWLPHLGHIFFVGDSPIASAQTSACKKASNWESIQFLFWHCDTTTNKKE